MKLQKLQFYQIFMTPSTWNFKIFNFIKFSWPLVRETSQKSDASIFLNFHDLWLELVSKELNRLSAILHVYAGGLNFMK